MGTNIYYDIFGNNIFNSIMMILNHEAVWRNDVDIITLYNINIIHTHTHIHKQISK